MTLKRFIAAAVCPQCHKQDTTAVFSEGDAHARISVRECVACGFRDVMESQVHPPAQDAKQVKQTQGTIVQVVDLRKAPPKN